MKTSNDSFPLNFDDSYSLLLQRPMDTSRMLNYSQRTDLHPNIDSHAMCKDNDVVRARAEAMKNQLMMKQAKDLIRQTFLSHYNQIACLKIQLTGVELKIE
jgi:hypothetical protein